MEKNLPIIIQLLGGFSISVGDKTITERGSRSSKTWKLLEYLVTFRKRDVSQNELIDVIWEDKEISNPVGALKTLSYRARRLLDELGYPEEIIVQHRGSYAWNSNIDCCIDAELFEQLCIEVARSDQDYEVRINKYFELIDTYKGDYLPNASQEPWAVPIFSYYRSLFVKAVREFVFLLKQREEYEHIVQICRRAMIIDSCDEDIHYELIYALYKLRDYKVAFSQYDYYKEVFWKQYATTPSERMRDLFKEISNMDGNVEHDLTIIAEQFSEDAKKKGAFLCEYSFFRDMYRLQCRNAFRVGNAVSLCLFTITNLNGDVPEQKVINRAMQVLSDVIQFSLRSGDIFTRYSISQFLVMISAVELLELKRIEKRIHDQFHKNYIRQDILLQIKLKVTEQELR